LLRSGVNSIVKCERHRQLGSVYWRAGVNGMLIGECPKRFIPWSLVGLLFRRLRLNHFQLAIHFETKEIPMLAFTRASLVRPDRSSYLIIRTALLATLQPAPTCFRLVAVTSFERQAGSNLAGSRNTPMALLATALPSLAETTWNYWSTDAATRCFYKS